MCVVSAVMPTITPYVEPFFQPYKIPNSNELEILRQMKEIIERLDRIDKALGLTDCKVEQAEKDRIFKKLKELVDEHA